MIAEYPAVQFWWLSHELLRLETLVRDEVEPGRVQILSAEPKAFDKGLAFEIKMAMDFAEGHCKNLKFQDTAMLPLYNIKAALQRIELLDPHHAPDPSHDISRDLKALRKNIELELGKRKFVYVAPDKTKYFAQEQIFGKEVFDSFPSARQDLAEAGDCLACGVYSAAVFHLMRAVEWGLRSFCVHLKVLRIPKSKKLGPKKYVPLAFAEWEKILETAREAIDKKIGKMKRGPLKQQTQEFYYPLLQDLQGFRDAWRNHVMHSRATYREKDTEAILDYVSRFLKVLSTKVSE